MLYWIPHNSLKRSFRNTMWHFFSQDGGAIKKISKFDKLFKFQKGLEHSNSRNKGSLCNIEIISSYKPNVSCNLYDIFILYTFLMERQTSEKLLKWSMGKERIWTMSTHFGRRQTKRPNLFFNETFNPERNHCLKLEKRRMWKDLVISAVIPGNWEVKQGYYLFRPCLSVQVSEETSQTWYQQTKAELRDPGSILSLLLLPFHFLSSITVRMLLAARKINLKLLCEKMNLSTHANAKSRVRCFELQEKLSRTPAPWLCNSLSLFSPRGGLCLHWGFGVGAHIYPQPFHSLTETVYITCVPLNWSLGPGDFMSCLT